jgi:hypothetical protein
MVRYLYSSPSNCVLVPFPWQLPSFAFASYLKPFANRPEPAAILNSVHEICANSLSKGKHPPLLARGLA